jgi:hypothetical protein
MTRRDTTLEAANELPGDQDRANEADEEQCSAPAVMTDDKRSEITAETLRELCLNDETEEVSIENRTVTGPLNLAGTLLDRSLRFRDCEFTDLIDLTGARCAERISWERCELRSLRADRFSVNGDLLLENVHSQGIISLCGARITGHLRCTDSSFCEPEGKALDASAIMVEGSALFDGKFCARGEFNLAFARIDGVVDMTGGRFLNEGGSALVADGIRVGIGMRLTAGFKAVGTVVLTEAHVSGKLKCSAGRFSASQEHSPAINAQLLEADEVSLDAGFKASGRVYLDGSTITGRLSCDNGEFRSLSEGGIALSANGLDCRIARLGDGFRALGEVQLMGARIARELNCTGGTFFNPAGRALRTDGLICGDKIYLNDRFTATGEVGLRNTQIKTELNCTNGTFNGDDIALAAGGLTCEGNVYLNECFTAAGTVELDDATISHELNCQGAKCTKLGAQRLSVGAKFDWRPRETPEEVDVSFATIGLLRDMPSSWPANKKTRLVGFTVRSLDMEPTAQDRITWLGQTESYAPDVYQQLIRIYRQYGLNKDSQNIAIASQRDRRRRGDMSKLSKAWSWFLDRLVGYGYQMHRPLFIVLCLGAIGSFVFYLAKAHHIMEPVAGGQGATIDANECTPRYPCFMPIPYSYELFLPVVNLRQLTFWLPSGATLWGQILFAYVWTAILTGWMFSIAIAAGIGHLFSQRD